jgi:hypothetical protein
MRFVVRAVLGTLVVFAAHASARADVDPNRIDEALNRASSWLYKQQTIDNTWEKEFENHGDQKTGQTALAVYALLVSGESHQDPRIVKAVEFLKKTDTTGVYALGMRCQLWLRLPQTPETKRAIAKDAKVLLNSIIAQGDGRGFYAYNTGLKPWSHSRAQYAVLGMWAAAQAGVEVPDAFWRLVEKSWIEHQDSAGGWSYKFPPNDQYPITPGMTAVGVATLFITQDYLHAEDFARAGGTPDNPYIDRGMKWMIDNFSKVATDEKYPRDFPYSTLYAVERIGVAGGLKYFGTIDWYDKGASWLLGKQYAAGNWPSELGSSVVSTSLAMLFLSQGRAPIALNKLDYTRAGAGAGADDGAGAGASAGKPAPWNQRPRDVANVSRFIGKQLERDIKWQTVNLPAPFQDWLDAPILYISGDEPLAFDETAKQKLRQFVEAGGLVLGNADSQSKPFSTSFSKLGQELFPAYEFRELPSEHVIYTNQQFPRSRWKSKPSVLGLSNGVRELMLLVPQADPARAWQMQAVASHPDHFELASNIFLYCTDSKNLRKRGESHVVTRNAGLKSVRSIKVARLKHSGNWDPEPRGWRRLADLMHNRNRIALEVSGVELETGSLDGFKFAHMTCTSKIALSDAARTTLKTFVESLGGTLIVDAAGGSSDFASSIEQQLAEMFPGSSLVQVPKDNKLFTSGAKPMTTFGYRPFAGRVLGELKDEPRLRGIEVNGRLAVIFSREDLSAGLVGQTVDGVIGYDPATATEIMSRILMYSP